MFKASSMVRGAIFAEETLIHPFLKFSFRRKDNYFFMNVILFVIHIICTSTIDFYDEQLQFKSVNGPEIGMCLQLGEISKKKYYSKLHYTTKVI